ncbi:NAD(P)/FAD-dependent oxidoreductase [Ottowia thiooxydans]|uniref:NAD(P)/FAD-dependent oxidoreductase n=1 Tax=Ottowia thiooxydans TaxID=219182 RepID=UPI000412A9AD|nr:NAD(P)/FAD-dependent oxidoreductase [Ottowia thiooxydans]
MTSAKDFSSPIETDVAIIGAGPAGLFSAFELGLHELSFHIIDALPRIGGQPVELYADKPIYDIPGTPVCSGQQLADGLMKQIAPFNPPLHLGHRVDELQRQPDGRFLLSTQRGLRLLAKAVFIAAGVGAFEPKRLKLEGLNALEDHHLFYRTPDAEHLAGQQVVIIGGEDSALEQAIDLATREVNRPASVTLVYRRDGFQAAPATVERFRSLLTEGKLSFVIGQAQGFDAPEGRLAALHILDVDGKPHTLTTDKLLVLQGFTPKLGPIADWHLAMERKQLVVDTEKFQTSEPGIFAMGDVNTYPGKRKLILSGFHEATLAAFALAEQLAGAPVPLQYTTSSTLLHRLLGLSSPQTP